MQMNPMLAAIKNNKPKPETDEFEERFRLCWWKLTFIHKQAQSAFDSHLYKGRKRSLRWWCVFAIVFFTPFLFQEGFNHPSTVYAFVQVGHLMSTILIAIFSLIWLLIFNTSSKVEFLVQLNFAFIAMGMPIYTFSEIPSDDPALPPLLLWVHIVWYGIQIGYVIIFHVNFVLFWLGNILFFGSMALATEIIYEFDCIERLPASQLFWSATLSILMTAKIVHSALKANCLLFKHLRMIQAKKEHEVKEKVHNLKRQYVAQTLHDIGTPLTTLMLGQEMFDQWELPEEMDDIVKTNNCAIEMMALTRKKALDYMKFEDTGVLFPNLAPTDLHHILHDKCKRIMTGFNSQNDVGLKFVIEDNVAPKVITDGDWIWEMLCNYLSNALKFTKYGSVEARISLSEDEQYILFEVKDTGPGVSDEQKALLFRPFSQLQDDSGGTGLGLYSVSCKAFSLKGKVGVRDNPDADSGAVFFFSIPNRPFLEDTGSCIDGHVEQTSNILAPTSKSKKNEDSLCAFSFTEDSSNAKKPMTTTIPPPARLRSIVFTEEPLCPAILDCAHQNNFVKVQTQGTDRGNLLQVTRQDSRSTVDSQKGLTQRSSGDIPIVISPTNSLIGLMESDDICAESVADEKGLSQSMDCHSANRDGPSLSSVSKHSLPASRSMDSAHSSFDSKKTKTSVFLKAASSCGSSGRGRTLLLIEDEKSIAKFIVRMLSKVGYEVVHAENGLIGLEKMKCHYYHIVLCDITMPGLDGFETVSRFREWEALEIELKNRTQKQVIVALSANQVPEIQQKATSSGFNSFLSKPVKLKVLLAEIEKYACPNI